MSVRGMRVCCRASLLDSEVSARDTSYHRSPLNQAYFLLFVAQCLSSVPNSQPPASFSLKPGYGSLDIKQASARED